MAALFACLFIAVVAIGQVPPAKPPQRPKVLPPDVASAPGLPMATNSEFQNAVLAVEKHLEVGEFDEAGAELRLLPHRQIRVAWDDSNVPARLRPAFEATREHSFADWSSGIGLEIKIVKDEKTAPPDIRFSFAEVLGKPVDSKVPLSVALFPSTAKDAPRLDVVLALHRGDPLRPSNDVDISGDVGFAMGQYLGLAESKVPLGVMFRQTAVAYSQRAVAMGERVTATHNFDLIDFLTSSVKEKKKVSAGLANVFVSPTSLDPGEPQLQGTILSFNVQVNNRGLAPMETRLVPDCSCFSTATTQIIPPGGSVVFPVQMQTIEYGGDIHKELYLVSSDPEQSCITIPVHVVLKPRYRFLTPNGRTVLVDDNDAEFPLYLTFEGNTPDEINVALVGLPGHATYEKWSGSLADPELNEPARMHHGYKITIELDKKDVPRGRRTYLDVKVSTTDSVFRTIIGHFYAQNGIVSSPPSLYLGHIAPVEREFDFLVQRPTKGFHILDIKCEDKHFKVTQSAPKDKLWEHSVRVIFDGKAPEGELTTTIKIVTDDKDQPVINVPVVATVG